ncbi:sigma-70 family RNA polymerase sigma factor family protein [Streptomyces eurythermus]|uniref:hypothetical protein n=1 Tax=Streptomyces eurythermus TaxID=42237 RepID=UPI00370106AB
MIGPREEVREPRAYLVRVTTGLAIDRPRRAQRRAEAHVGPWLPEPYLTEFAGTAPDSADRAVLADTVSLAVLDVRLVGDSGGKAKAPVRVLHTADKADRFLVGAARTAPADRTHRVLETNGGPALLTLTGGESDSLFQVDIADLRITSVYVIRNPDKLRHLTAH